MLSPFNVGRVDYNRDFVQARDYFPTLKGRGEEAPVAPAQHHSHISSTQGQHKYFKTILTRVVGPQKCLKVTPSRVPK